MSFLMVKPGGALFLAIFNDQGGTSRRWRMIKQLYNESPRLLRPLISIPIITFYEGRYAIMDLLKGRNPLTPWIQVEDSRGMHKWYNWMDWIGGYPFEVARPDDVFEFYRLRGFRLATLKSRGGRGCNEYVFEKDETEKARREIGERR